MSEGYLQCAIMHGAVTALCTHKAHNLPVLHWMVGDPALQKVLWDFLAVLLKGANIWSSWLIKWCLWNSCLLCCNFWLQKHKQMQKDKQTCKATISRKFHLPSCILLFVALICFLYRMPLLTWAKINLKMWNEVQKCDQWCFVSGRPVHTDTFLLLSMLI